MHSIGDVLVELQTLFQRHGTAWYVFGAQAVVVHGRPRQTLDIDVTVEVARDDVASLIARLHEAGYAPQVEDLVAFSQRTRALPMVHVDSGIPVDIILAGPGLEQEFFERVVTIDIEEIPIPFLSPEDLIAIKILAGRPKDIEDVAGIIQKQGTELDDERVRDVLKRLELALDRADLVTRFESCR